MEKKKKEKTYGDDQINEIAGKRLITLSDYDNLLLKKYYIHRIPVNVIDCLSFNVLFSLEEILASLEKKIPEILISNLKSVWIGKFEHLETANIESYFKDGIIYLSNKLSSVATFYNSLLYEIVHAVAENFSLLLISDSFLEKEFITKRISLYNRLTSSQKKIISVDSFMDINYNIILNKFLFTKLKQPYLQKLCEKLFIHTNGVSSLNEYFVITFYMYLASMLTPKTIQEHGPVVYSKVEMLIKYSGE